MIPILIEIPILAQILLSIQILIPVFKTVTQMFRFLYQVRDQREKAEALRSLFIATQSFGFLLIRQNNKYIKYESELWHKCSPVQLIHIPILIQMQKATKVREK